MSDVQPPSDPAAEAEIALREALFECLYYDAEPEVALDQWVAEQCIAKLIAGPLAPLLADIAALHTRAEEARFQGKQASSAAFAAEALAESWKSTAEAEAEIGNERAADLAAITRRQAFAQARTMSARQYRRLPNWAFAKDLFIVGSTYAWALCNEMGIDPDAYTASPWPDPAPSAAVAEAGQ